MSETHNYLSKHTERRRFGPYIMPSLFVLLEALACLLCLYIVNFGKDIQAWNKVTVSVAFIYFMLTSFRRYLNVIERSKIRLWGDVFNTKESEYSA